MGWFRVRKCLRVGIRHATVGVVVAVVVAVLVVAFPAPVNGSGFVVDYQPPTEAPIVDRYRPPPKPWMAGNRGVDFGTDAGAPITASADGRVIFADQVGGELHVTIEHVDGLRTSYSFLASLTVTAGDRVRVGDVIAIAGGLFHFGVRNPEGEYLDPEALLSGSLRPQVRLVPGTDQGLDQLRAQERRSLLDVFLDTGAAALEATASWSTTTSSLVAHYIVERSPSTHSLRMFAAIKRWADAQSTCTPPSKSPLPLQSRRLVVVVSGLGTSSESNTAWEISTRSLGYADQDVIRYSYAGGQAPRGDDGGAESVQQIDAQPFDVIPMRSFDALDSQQSVGVSADRLAALLQSVSAAQPGVPIDVIAHSQGGVVARLAIERAGAEGRLPNDVETLVTVSSPQQGAPLATGVVALGDTPGGTAALSQVRAAGLADELNHRLPAIGDLSETSAIITEMQDRPMPDGVRFVTIGGSGDLVVPGSSAIDADADASIILPTSVGKEAHGSLPSSPAATREIALAVAGQGPTCQNFGQAVSVFAQAEAIRYGETMAAAAAAVGAGVLPLPPADGES